MRVAGTGMMDRETGGAKASSENERDEVVVIKTRGGGVKAKMSGDDPPVVC